MCSISCQRVVVSSRLQSGGSPPIGQTLFPVPHLRADWSLDPRRSMHAVPSLVTLAQRAGRCCSASPGPWRPACHRRRRHHCHHQVHAIERLGPDRHGRRPGLPLSVALTLFAEERGWSRAGAPPCSTPPGVALLVLFYLVWPGPERKHEAIRYFQLSAGLHLLVAALPFLGQPETERVLAVQPPALPRLSPRRGVLCGALSRARSSPWSRWTSSSASMCPGELYGRLWHRHRLRRQYLDLPRRGPPGLAGAGGRHQLSPGAQGLRPIHPDPAGLHLSRCMLLAYLVKIVAGGEWPSGWIGWLVTSVAVAGLLGFLLVHPLRDDAGEGLDPDLHPLALRRPDPGGHHAAGGILEAHSSLWADRAAPARRPAGHLAAGHRRRATRCDRTRGSDESR